MNFVVTDQMVDVTVLVGVIFGILAAGFIVYGEIQRRRNRTKRSKGANRRGRAGPNKGGKSR